MGIGFIDALKPVTTDDVMPYEDNDDPLHRTHVIRPEDNAHILEGASVGAQDIVDMARLTGQEVIALCGYRFVPKHDPEKYEACQACFKVAEHLMRGE